MAVGFEAPGITEQNRERAEASVGALWSARAVFQYAHCRQQHHYTFIPEGAAKVHLSHVWGCRWAGSLGAVRRAPPPTPKPRPGPCVERNAERRTAWLASSDHLCTGPWRARRGSRIRGRALASQQHGRCPPALLQSDPNAPTQIPGVRHNCTRASMAACKPYRTASVLSCLADRWSFSMAGALVEHLVPTPARWVVLDQRGHCSATCRVRCGQATDRRGAKAAAV